MAAAGRGNDDPAPDDTAKAKLRQQALAWLKAELTTWGNLLETAPPQGRVTIAQILDHWKTDTDLAGIRESEGLARLSEAERREWQVLWNEVDSLRKRASTSGVPER